jgi:hypothetical protein
VVLNDVLGTDGRTLSGAPTAVKTAYLYYEDQNVKLDMYPADTLQQAQAFYGRPNSIERTLMLEQEGWIIVPNFHFGFMAKGFGWTTTTLPLAEYLRYWEHNIRNTTQVERLRWNAYWDELVKTKIADPADREAFNQDFTNTNRHFASPRPGIRCTFAWSLDEAERLDSQEQVSVGKGMPTRARSALAKAIKERINQLLDAVGEERIDSA